MLLYLTISSPEHFVNINVEPKGQLWGGGGGGGKSPGEKGVGGVQEAGVGKAGSGILRGRRKLWNIAQHLAIEKVRRGGTQQK